MTAPNRVQYIFGVYDPTSGKLLGLAPTGNSPYASVLGNVAIVATFAALRLQLGSVNQTIFATGKATQADGSGGTFVLNAADTSGAWFTGTVSGTVLTVITVNNGTLAVGQSVNRGDTGASIGTITSFGTGGGGVGTYNLSAPSTIAALLTFSADDNTKTLVGIDGSRWNLATDVIPVVDAATYGTDSGVVNAYVFTHSGASLPVTLTAGSLLRFTPLTTNTGASTLNADGTGVAAIIGVTGAALVGGELSSLGSVLLQSTGTQWQILATTGLQSGDGRSSVGTDSGAANAYVVTHNNFSLPAILTTGALLRFTPLNTNTAAVTINADGTGALAAVRANGTACTGGEFSSLGPVVVQYNGTAWQIVTTAGAQPGFERTAAEVAAGVTLTNPAYPPCNALRYGIIANNAGAAAANTTALKACWNPTTGIPGQWVFPNLTGADVYYFNNVIGVIDGVSVDLQSSTLNCTMTGSATDNQCGFLTAQRNFELKNGSIVHNYTYTSGSGNNGIALMFGGRGSDVGLFSAVYDSLLATPMGKITVRNVRVTVSISGGTPAGSHAVFMLGGLTGVVFENVWMEGSSNTYSPVYYEWGWATNESDTSARQTSHANNLIFRNVHCSNFLTAGLDGNGAYNVTIDGLWVKGCATGTSWGVGESRFYRPWTGNDLAGAKHGINIKNVAVDSCSGTAITVTGDSSTISGGYLGAAWQATHAYVVGSTVFNSPNLYVATVAGTSAGSGGPSGTGTGIIDGGVTWNYVNKQASTDLLDVSIENVAVRNAGGYGIRLSGATRAVLRNIHASGCQRGVVTDTDCTQLSLDGFTVRDSTSIGIQIGLSSTGIYSTTRQHVGSIRNGFIAGSAASAAIVIASCISETIENVRFGYEAAHDDVTETTQLQAVSAQADANNVIVRNCYVAGVASGNAFNLAASVDSRGCRLERIQGIKTNNGAWLTDFESSTAPTIGANGTITTQGLAVSRVTAGAAQTGIILQSGSWPGQEISVVHEGAAANTLTFAVSGTSHVADGVGDVIAGLTARRFTWDTVTALWYHAA